MKVPFMDLGIANRQIQDVVRRGMEDVISKGQFILGPAVAEFEAAFAAHSNVTECVGVASGTDALELILRGLEIGPGDEVILPALTFAATALAVSRVGARPVLVDVDSDCLLIDPTCVADCITPQTKAVIAVHLYGQIAPIEELEKVIENSNVVLLEDAAQSHGASRSGRRAGSLGLASAFSFYPTKNLGAFGDAGAVLTRDPVLAERIRALRNYGGSQKYSYPLSGFNSRLDTLQAVVLNAKLPHLEKWNEERRRAAAYYHDRFQASEEVHCLATLKGNEHVWHLYPVRVSERDEVMDALAEKGIQTLSHYPRPFHLEGAFAGLGYGQGSFPVTEAACQQLLSLPLFPGITESQQDQVVGALLEIVT